MQGKLNARLMFSLALCAACVGCSSESADWCYVTKTSCTLEDGSEMNNGEGYCKDSSTYTKCTNGRLIDDNCDTGACRADGCLVSPVQCTKDGTEYAPGTGYCDADGKSVICGTDGKWGTPEVCPSNQVCSKDGCVDAKPCGTTKHGDKVCNDHTDIYICHDGALKPEATDANGDVVSCPRNYVCDPDPNEENSEVACRQVECTPNALACAGEQFQLCGGDEKWGDPKDMPDGFNATCKDGDDEVPTCASDSLTASYCDDDVAMNCAIYTETGKEGQIEWSKCGDGFICDKDATSSTYHTCIPEPCNANEKDYVRCKLGTYQICDGTSWSVPATIPESVDVNCKQENPDEPGVIQCKEEGVYEDRYCGDSHVFSCSGEGAEIIKVTPGYCDGEGQYVECKDNAWEDPDKCSEHNQICSANGCRDPKPCNETTQHGDKSCIENTKIYVCDDGTLKPEATDANGDVVSCPDRHECKPPEDNPKAVVCYPVDCVTNELACAGEQFQLCVNQKWDTPKDMPTGFNATCTGGDGEVPTCDPDHLTESYCDDYVAMNCALYTETGKEGHVAKSTCGEGFVCDTTAHTCVPEPCTGEQKDHVRCIVDKFQVCNGTAWSVPATLTTQMQDIVNCKQDNPDEPGILVCKADVDPTKPKTACSHEIPDIQGNTVSLEINCTDPVKEDSTATEILYSTCGNSLVCDYADETNPLDGTCVPETCDEDNKLRCSEDLKQICKNGIWTTLDSVISDIPEGLLLCTDDDEVICKEPIEKEHYCAAYGTDTTLVLKCNTSGEKATVDEGCADPLLCNNDIHECVECLSDNDCEVPIPACQTKADADRAFTCVECTSNEHCEGHPNGNVCDPADNKCHECFAGEVRCITKAEIESGLMIGDYPVASDDIGKLNICSAENKWSASIIMSLPGDSSEVFYCDESVLKCQQKGSYCQENLFITENVALTCDEAKKPAIGHLTCPNYADDPNREATFCHSAARHECLVCNPGDLKCNAGQYLLCNNTGVWEEARDLPTDIVTCEDGHLVCATGHETDSYCDEHIKIDCKLYPVSPQVVSTSVCGNYSNSCNADKCDNTCVEGDVRCVTDTSYAVCRDGQWQTTVNAISDLPAAAQALLESTSCTDGELRCKTTGTYCDDTMAMRCSRGDKPLLSVNCGEDYSCSGNSCSAPLGTICTSAAQAACAAQDKVCELKPDGTAGCWYKETFDYASPRFVNTTDETNINNYKVHATLGRAERDPGYMGYISWKILSDSSETLWSFKLHGRPTPSDKSSCVNGTQCIAMSNRGEHECPDKRCWRNRIDISDFDGGVSIIALDIKPWSQNWSPIEHNDVLYERNSMKLRIYLDDVYVPVAAFTTLPIESSGASSSNDSPRYTATFDLTRVALPTGIHLKEVKTITIKPEYVNIDGDPGDNNTMFGQTLFDNIRWVSAE